MACATFNDHILLRSWIYNDTVLFISLFIFNIQVNLQEYSVTAFVGEGGIKEECCINAYETNKGISKYKSFSEYTQIHH